MPTLNEIFEIEDAIEPGVCGAMATTDYPDNFFPRGKSPANRAPRIEAELVLGEVTGHRHPYRGQWVYDTWNAELIFRVFTNDQVREAENLHRKIRSTIRIRVQPFSAAITAAQLPYHVIGTISESGTVPAAADGSGYTVSELHFKCVVSIRSNAWPA